MGKASHGNRICPIFTATCIRSKWSPAPKEGAHGQPRPYAHDSGDADEDRHPEGCACERARQLCGVVLHCPPCRSLRISPTRQPCDFGPSLTDCGSVLAYRVGLLMRSSATTPSIRSSVSSGSVVMSGGSPAVEKGVMHARYPCRPPRIFLRTARSVQSVPVP